ncbi:MAG: YebC/PmpR family DNA-binding transcriptional regulator [Clostridia bacterium]|nr:YebC/PmpR family DNA-binding transcriptional regulator [Clostridia bacterium]
MSGHSKWNNIKRKKEKTDAQRGRVFTKIGREIAVAVKAGGPDPVSNPRLGDVIAKAKAANMPNDTISRSIKRAAGEDANVQYDEITYEGYGVAGVAVIVEALTDNRNRTASEVRHCFDKCGGSLGATGCVNWMFDKKGVFIIDSEGKDPDEVMMTALEVGAEDVNETDDAFEITCDPADFHAVRTGLEDAGLEFVSAEIEMIPQNTVSVDEDARAKIEKLIDMLEESDDVQNIYHNAELPDDEE